MVRLARAARELRSWSGEEVGEGFVSLLLACLGASIDRQELDLRERGLLFVGIDVINGNLTEINVTSPTGIRAIARLGGPDVAAKVWDVIEQKRAK